MIKTAEDEEEGGLSEAGSEVAGPAWQPLPCMLHSRSHFGCTALSSGRIAVAGGCGEKGALLDFAEVFEPHGAAEAGQWRALPTLPFGVEGCALTALPPPAGDGAGLLLLIGGTRSTTEDVGGVVLSLGHVGAAWTAGLGKLSVPRAFPSVFVAAGAVWVAGGRAIAAEAEQEVDCSVMERNTDVVMEGKASDGAEWGVAGGTCMVAQLKLGALGGVVVLGGAQ